MKHVETERRDHAALHRESADSYLRRAKAAKERFVAKGDPADMQLHEALLSHAEELDSTPPAELEWHEAVKIVCPSKTCPDPVFTASFDAAQQTIQCPSCGFHVFIDPKYRGGR